MDQAFLEFAAGGRAQLDLAAPRVTLGRGPANDVQLDDGTVSAQHAAIEWQPDGWTIQDLGSSTGTHVNGRRISQPRPLDPGDRVRLGQTELVFRMAGTRQQQDTVPSPAGYLDMTEEWAPPKASTQPARAPRPSPSAADRPPVATPAPRSAPAVGPAAPGPAHDPFGVRRNGGSAQVRGIARNVQRHTRDQTKVLVFRVECYDASGDRLDPVGVEFHHYRGGGLNDGEEVEVTGRWRRGTLRAQQVSNLTTHAEVLGPSAAAKVARTTCLTLFFIACGCIALVIVVAFLAGV